MGRDIVAEFFHGEINQHTASILISALAEPASGTKYFTFNAFNVLLDFDRQVATIEDELDPEAEESIPLGLLADRLKAWGGRQ
jgi:hypothetical protein